MKVESSHIDDVEWEDGKLLVTFKDGSVYEYSDVPIGVYQELLGAESIGKFFYTEIRNRFDFTKRNED